MWNENESENPLLISKFTKNADPYIHMFCDCDKVLPLGLWDNLSTFIYKKCGERLNLTTFQKMFGLDLLSSEHSRGINFVILYLKLYINRCKFQQCRPNFQAFLKLVQIKIKTENEDDQFVTDGQF